MIVVKIEKWPNGRVSGGREIGRVFIYPQENGYNVNVDEYHHVEQPESISEIFNIQGRETGPVVKLLARVFAHFSEWKKTTN